MYRDAHYPKPGLDTLTDTSDFSDSIANSPEALPVLEWQKEVLERRRAAHQRNPGAAIPWEQALHPLRKGNS